MFRLTPGPGYLEALVEPNVDFISNGIKRITETGIETVDGNHREYDTIVTATGFDTSYRPRVPIGELIIALLNTDMSRAHLCFAILVQSVETERTYKICGTIFLRTTSRCRSDPITLTS